MKAKKLVTTASSLVAGVFLCSAASATDIDLEEYGQPAIISFHADTADVTTSSSGQKITFAGISSLATMSASVHKHNSRIFTAFPTSELPEAWNSCNAMKLENGLFHSDGVNSVMTFTLGPSNHNEHGHVSTAPLVTQSEPIRPTLGGEDGALYVMLADAEAVADNLSFMISVPLRSKAVADGQYQNVMVATECVMLPPSAHATW